MIPENTKFKTLYDHYKETLSAIKESNKLRDRLLVFVLALVMLLLFQTISPSESAETISAFLLQKFGITVTTSIVLVGSMVWFGLLFVMVRYFQTVIFTERQYPYLHKLEERLSSDYGNESVFTREGKSYLDKYPRFSNWTYWLYTFIFPLSLLFVTSIKILDEWEMATSVSLSLVFNSVIFLCVAITIILYLGYMHSTLSSGVFRI